MSFITRPVLYLRLLRACLVVIKDPQRIDRVLDLSHDLHDEFDGHSSLGYFKTNSETKGAFVNRPLPMPIPLAELAALPAATLGRHLFEFIKAANVDPKDLTEYRAVNPVDDDQYLLEHFLQTHDIWHVVTGFGTSVADELGLQGFYAAQSPAKFPYLIIILGLLNGLLFKPAEVRERLSAVAKGFRMGQAAHHLFGQDWGQQWSEPLASVRERMRLDAKMLAAS